MSLALRSILIWLVCAAACGCAGVSVGESGDGETPCVSEERVPVTDLSAPAGDFDRSPEALLAQVEGTARGRLELYKEVDGEWVYPGPQVSFRIALRPLRDSLQLMVSEPLPDTPNVRCPDELTADTELDIDIDDGAELRLRDRGTLSIYASPSSSVSFSVLDGFETDLVAYFSDGAVPGEDAALLGSLSLDDESGTEWSAHFYFAPVRACRPDDYDCSGGVTTDHERGVDSVLLGEGSASIESAKTGEGLSLP